VIRGWREEGTESLFMGIEFLFKMDAKVWKL
jgi:hypothetical protein